MHRASIRQPVVLYALVFMMALAAIVLTLSAFSLINASRRAYRRATQNELLAISMRGPPSEADRWIEGRATALEVDIGVVTASRSAFGLDLTRARDELRNASNVSDVVVTPLGTSGEEAYLVGQIDHSVPLSIAFVEVSRIVPFVVIGALACAALLAFMVNRLLLPQLSILAEIAEDATALRGGLEQGETPNEILEIARRFRATVRQLKDEQAELAAQKTELERMQVGLVRASKLASVGRLAAGIAHEIGNPLAAVLGYLSLLSEGLDEPARTEVLDRSSKELTRIAETIRKLLTYARTGEESFEPSAPLCTRKVIEEALALVSGHPAFRGVIVHGPSWAEDGPDAVGQPGRLNQVIVNLLLNAAQALDTRTEKHIRIDRLVADEDVRISVEDSGPGIDENLLDQIFDPFFTTKDPGEGAGLGLAVSRAIMEGMGGDLTVSSKLGEGARFTARIPKIRP